ncbi:SDR family oxidoreductase [Bacillus tianshenii]|uniref:SDR family oxidoreductase n=1 Tax=Sutcliffiella tianshenii TaxID=1463404 RepID=UPI001CD5DF50|nr:SDR family oxidoreductase [Bacillus tianshenii]MCA1321785.1 SDR family oxidoreductase [Bacillus tianshenii]
MTTTKTVLITGASGGFGKTFTKVFLQAGYHVIATIRQENKKQDVLFGLSEQERRNLTLMFLDVSHDQSVAHFHTALRAYNRIDVLINNAGFAVAGFAEELTIEEYKLQFETNFFGVIRVTNAVLPLMRKQGFGRIINISSISGLVGFPGLSPYVSSKYALEGYSESLRLEVKDFGIDVVLLEPGSFQTNIWTSGTHLSENAGGDASPYKSMFTSINNRMMADREKYGNPIEVGVLALIIAESKRAPSLRYTVGKGVNFMLTLKRLIPWKIWERLVLKQLQKP